MIGFVSNGSFIDSRGADGLRYSLYKEFNYIYIFNLRGNQRTQGEVSRREGGKIFGSGSRTPIAISVLVKDGSNNHNIFYHDIGDYLSTKEKLNIINEFSSIKEINWQDIFPDKYNDWINQRDESYYDYPSVVKDIFNVVSVGVKTNRDSWDYGFCLSKVLYNSNTFIEHYNSQLKDSKKNNFEPNLNPEFIKWSRGLFNMLKKGEKLKYNEDKIIKAMYRPFTKKYIYLDRGMSEMPGKFKDLFSDKKSHKIIYVTGRGSKKDFTAVMVNSMPDYSMMSAGEGLSLESIYKDNLDLGSNFNVRSNFGLSPNDVFYYVYGVFYSNEYVEKYSSNLSKNFPHIPLLKNKEKYVEIGKKLSDLHLNYENQPSWEGVHVEKSSDNPSYKVTKMKHPKRGVLDKIIFNEDITITNIPEKAYEYVLNGKPAIEWIIDQYRIKTDKKSGITDDPNEFSDDPKYILNLLLSIITVSMKTLDLVGQLPEFEVIEEDK